MKFQNNNEGLRSLGVYLSATKGEPGHATVKDNKLLVKQVRGVAGIDIVDQSLAPSKGYTYRVDWHAERFGYIVYFYNTETVAGFVPAFL